MNKVMTNKDLLTNIFSYLGKLELKRLIYSFRSNVHFDYLVPQEHVLLYGQVQSGKTEKIMSYVKHYKPSEIKVIIIQNSICMLTQYLKALTSHGITYKAINKSTSMTMYNNENVIITIHNKYRMNSLSYFMAKNNINKYCLILDESDQYLEGIQKECVFKCAKNVLHVTATPFKYAKQFNVDKLVTIKPKPNYIGIDNVNIVPFVTENHMDTMLKITNIIKDDLLRQINGFMLINSFTTIPEMIYVAKFLSSKYPTIPFAVLSTKTQIVLNGIVKMVKIKNIQTFIDGFSKYPHIVFIANRLSNRGINYTTSDYTRNITHQITRYSGNYTSFIQKCRIFGIRKNISQKPIMYCLVKNEETKANFIMKLKNTMNKINGICGGKYIAVPKVINMIELKNLCRIHKIKGFSKLRKAQLIELLTNNNINIYGN